MEPATPDTPPAPVEESTGNAALDRRLSQGVLRGDTGTDRAQVFIAAFLVAIAALLVGSPSLSIPLHGAELEWLVDSQELHRLVTAPAAFHLQPETPFALLRIATVYGLFGEAGLRFAALVLHAFSAVMLYFLAARLMPNQRPVVPLLAGLFFAVHPFATGALAYLPAWGASQALALALMATVFALRSMCGNALQVPSLIIALISIAAAAASHFAAIFLPLFIVLAHLIIAGGDAKVSRPIHAAFILMMLMLLVAHAASGIGDGGGYVEGTLATMSAQARLAADTVLGFVSLQTPRLLPGAHTDGSLVGTLLFLVLLVGFVGGLITRNPLGALCGWVFLAVAAVPCLTPQNRIVSPGTMYLSAAALPLLLPWLAAKAPAGIARTITTSVILAATAAAAWMTYSQLVLLQTPTNYWAEAVRNNGGDARAQYYLGRAFLREADAIPTPEAAQPAVEQALAPLQFAFESAEDEFRTDVGMHYGITLARLGRSEPAIDVLREVLRRDPTRQTVAVNLALLLEAGASTNVEQLRSAVSYFRYAEELGPLPAPVLVRYAMATAGLGNVEHSVTLLRQAEAAGAGEQAVNARRPFEAIAARAQQLRQESEQALQQDPRGVEGVVAMAEANFISSQVQRAFYLLDRVLRRDPAQARAWSLMGLLRAQTGDAAAFITEWGNVPGVTWETWLDLARRCAAANAWDDALAYLNHAATNATPRPEIALAEVALALRQPQRAEAFYRQATEKYPQDPAPWLGLADFAIATQQNALADNYLREAQQRGASEESLQQRREKAGVEAGERPEIPRTIIR